MTEPVPTESVSLPEYHEADLDSFRKFMQAKMSTDPHGEHIKVSELNELHMMLYDKYLVGALTDNELKKYQNEAEANNETSSYHFLAWLSNQVGEQMLSQGRNKATQE